MKIDRSSGPSQEYLMFVAAAIAAWALLLPGRVAHASGNSSTPVVLVSIDTLRPDHLSCYGYRALRTASIDTLTQGGTLFTHVNSQAPLTLPSHVSLFTSRNPFATGVEDNGDQLGPHAVTLTTVLKSRGYRTAAFVGGFVLDRRFGLNQ